MSDAKMEDRLAAIGALPSEMQPYALVDWRTVATLTGNRDIEYAREKIIQAGIPLVRISERRALPRWGDLRKYLTPPGTEAAA